MHVVVLILTVFLYGVGHQPLSVAKVVASHDECVATGQALVVKVDEDSAVSGAVFTCGELDVAPVSKS